MRTNKEKTKATVAACLNFDDVEILMDICKENRITMSAILCALVEKMLEQKDISDIIERAKEIRVGRRAL